VFHAKRDTFIFNRNHGGLADNHRAAYALPQQTPRNLRPPPFPRNPHFPMTTKKTVDYPYLLRSYEGSFRVYHRSGPADMVFDVYVRTLPD
jgi:hypothetical protein